MLDRLTLTFPKFARLVSTGSEAAARVDQVKYVRLTNSCAVFTLVISVIYAAYFAALGAWGPVLLEALMVAMGPGFTAACLVPSVADSAREHRGHHTSSR